MLGSNQRRRCRRFTDRHPNRLPLGQIALPASPWDGMGIRRSHLAGANRWHPDIHLDRLFRAGGMFIRDGSGAVSLCDVACGRLLGFTRPTSNPGVASGVLPSFTRRVPAPSPPLTNRRPRLQPAIERVRRGPPRQRSCSVVGRFRGSGSALVRGGSRRIDAPQSSGRHHTLVLTVRSRSGLSEVPLVRGWVTRI